jgi:cob(I)alamin adenosyltransferase
MNKSFKQKGLVICYIGDGKGKTTAAMGLAVRASGAGMNVLILQFVKARQPKPGEKLASGEWPVSSEIEFFNKTAVRGNLGKIDNRQLGAGFVGILGDRKDREVHIREALRGLELAREKIFSQEYQVVILDEIISAVEVGVLKQEDVLGLVKNKPDGVHLVLTGHKKYQKLITECNVVTEMRMVKHPYYEGILAQKGIDY